MKKTLLWMVGLTLILSCFVVAPRAHAQAKEIDVTGNWQGTLQAGQGLRIVMKITKADGKLKGISYSIDQGGQPIPLNSITVHGTAFNFAISMLDVTYAGTLSADGKTITGNQTQGGHTAVMNFEHVTPEATWAIPEPPKAMAADAVLKFEVITVKPSDPNRPGKLFTIRGRHLMTINTTMNDMVTFAYGLHVKQIIGAPEWFATDKFDLDGVPEAEGRPNTKQMKELIQSALTDRFKLTFHHDQKELSVYALTVAKGGPKMTETIHQPNDPKNFIFRGKLGDLMVTNSTMKDFCDGMQSAVMDRPVVDHTGLTARYDFNLNWTPDDSQFAMFGPRPTPKDDPNAPPSLYTALQEQLGLKLEATKANADVFVIDHVEKPAAN
ncbi:MAG TPA: TIGR03435 family protein [Nitrospira sp.]|nr:TIGR03435 family protein [Nitrospira sp.]